MDQSINPESVIIVYQDSRGKKHSQLASAMIREGLMLDPNTGEQMSIVGMRKHTSL